MRLGFPHLQGLLGSGKIALKGIAQPCPSDLIVESDRPTALAVVAARLWNGARWTRLPTKPLLERCCWTLAVKVLCFRGLPSSRHNSASGIYPQIARYSSRAATGHRSESVAPRTTNAPFWHWSVFEILIESINLQFLPDLSREMSKKMSVGVIEVTSVWDYGGCNGLSYRIWPPLN